PAAMSQSLKLGYVLAYRSASPRATSASLTPAEYVSRILPGLSKRTGSVGGAPGFDRDWVSVALARSAVVFTAQGCSVPVPVLRTRQPPRVANVSRFWIGS